MTDHIGRNIVLKSLADRTGLEFAPIPKGDFIMGSKANDPLAWDDEKPQNSASISYDYWCGRHPVTNRQFAKFADATQYISRAEQTGWAWVWRVESQDWEKIQGACWRHPNGPADDLLGLEDHPVVCVSFYDAMAYVDWLNIMFFEILLEGYIFNLPGELEWEKAARGTHGRQYPWGDQFEPNLCYWRGRPGREGTTSPVGSRSPESDSPYGCAGMAGNAWEWTITLWGSDKDKSEFGYPYQMFDGREDINAGEDTFRIIRGGSFKDDEKGVRSACRDLDPPGLSFNNLGFRIFITSKDKR